jgi:hypothetical protein
MQQMKATAAVLLKLVFFSRQAWQRHSAGHLFADSNDFTPGELRRDISHEVEIFRTKSRYFARSRDISPVRRNISTSYLARTIDLDHVGTIDLIDLHNEKMTMRGWKYWRASWSDSSSNKNKQSDLPVESPSSSVDCY